MRFKTEPDAPEAIDRILNPLVRRWFRSRFPSYSLPQLHAVMEIHSRRNILVSAPTGATKTLTGFLSVLNELIDSSTKGILEDRVYCVYVSPLKALNNDIEKNLKGPLREIEGLSGGPLGIRVAVRTGDTTPAQRARMLKRPPHILITTPESLAILLTSPRFGDHLTKVSWVIVDEIHALAENKRGVHLSLTLEKLQHAAQHVSRVGLSATVAPLEEVASFLVGSEDGRQRECLIVDVQFIKQLDLQVLSPTADFVGTGHARQHEAMYALIDELVQKHTTTLIFTNTRAGTERVVDHLKERFPARYTENIGAHHGSLSKEHRLAVEDGLREGRLKAVVSSTSLELGIDIGYIDLVICLGSPKSVSRALQRIGRSGHRLHDITTGRIIVLDRDDLVECGVLLKSAVEKRIDRIHIPKNCLDVLAQQVYGFAISRAWDVDGLYRLVRQSHCYQDLARADYNEIIDYLAGKFAGLEDRHIYAKVWHDEERRMIGRRGRLARVLFMTNIGTIPDETQVLVKLGEQVIGTVDEAFLERLRKGDVFVLGGNLYQFQFARGMVAQVSSSTGRPPTVPSWYSEMLPLSFDLALSIGRFRRYMDDRLSKGEGEEALLAFIDDYLHVDARGASALHEYFRQQYDYSVIPTDLRIVVEHYSEEKRTYIVFHALFGRRVNDCLSRALAYVISRLQHHDVEIGINDNGFYLASEKPMQATRALSMLKADKLHVIMDLALNHTEVLARRFRHCAARALMILRTYKGREKYVGRQQVSSMILMNALRRINPNFSIIKEAKREVLEDLMDFTNTKEVLERIEAGTIKVQETRTTVPSPFAANLILQSYTDILKIEDRVEFLRRMHQMVLAKIALGKGRREKGL
ncbi:ATP-dependent helicase [Candidatus Woesearchaeota archaeon]|nr:ATP-dependent helicase [Candidatus Woesearchaeota archaeon]